MKRKKNDSHILFFLLSEYFITLSTRCTCSAAFPLAPRFTPLSVPLAFACQDQRLLCHLWDCRHKGHIGWEWGWGRVIFVTKQGTAPCSAPEAHPPAEERGPQPQMPPFPPFLFSQPSGPAPEYHPLGTFLIPTSVQPIFINNFYILGILDMKISKPSSCL